MRVHISIDMEGIAGVADRNDTTPGAPHYEYCRQLMTAECNAVIEGCFDAGADVVVVDDSHGSMQNLLQGELDPRVRVMRGCTKRFGMIEALAGRVSDASGVGTDATMFVGYHAAAGNGDGVLNHTMLAREILGVHVNTEPAGELRLNAAMAGWLGVPVVLVSGDDVVCDEARTLLGGHVETVEVKQAVDRYSTLSLHPEASRAALREGATQALARLADARPYRVEMPATLRIEWSSTSIAALCEGIPGVQRVGAREVQCMSGDYAELYRLFIILGLLAGYTASVYG